MVDISLKVICILTGIFIVMIINSQSYPVPATLEYPDCPVCQSNESWLRTMIDDFRGQIRSCRNETDEIKQELYYCNYILENSKCPDCPDNSPKYIKASKDLWLSERYNDKPAYEGDNGPCYYYSSNIVDILQTMEYKAEMYWVQLPCDTQYFNDPCNSPWNGGHYIVCIGGKSGVCIESLGGYEITPEMRGDFGL